MKAGGSSITVTAVSAISSLSVSIISSISDALGGSTIACAFDSVDFTSGSGKR
jgi:hypothetical protein